MALKPKLTPTSVNINDQMQDSVVTHAINLERLKASEAEIVKDILDDLGLSIQKQLEKIDPTGIGPTYRARRLAKLQKNVEATIKANFAKIKGASSTSLSGVSKMASKATQNSINKTLGVPIASVLPPAANLRQLAKETLVEGEIVKKYWDQQSNSLRNSFLRQMRVGIAGGEGLGPLVNRVRGTKAANFTDGIMNVSKHKAEALVRSSVAAVNNAAALATIDANGDMFNGVQWIATLDSRTSDICKARSGLTWDQNFKPIGHNIAWSPPPAHFNCRSTIIGVLKSWDELATKPLPAIKKSTLKAELTKSMKSRGLSDVLIAKNLLKSQQSMDGFVAGDLKFEQWLKGKPEKFQIEVLGEGKWNLWNSGQITFVDLVNQSSQPRSLAEIQALVDAGRTSIAKADKAAKAAAKAQKEAEELAAKAAAKAEFSASIFISDLSIGDGSKPLLKAYDKLKTSKAAMGSKVEFKAAIEAEVLLQSSIEIGQKAAAKIVKKEQLGIVEQSVWDGLPTSEKGILLLAEKTKNEIVETKAKIAQYKAGGKGLSYHKEAYNKLKKQGKLGLTDVSVFSDLSAIETLTVTITESYKAKSLKNAIKKKLAAGKPLTNAQNNFYQSLDAVEKADLDDAVLGVKSKVPQATVVAKREDEGLLFDDLEQVGGQGGSQTGGLFKSKIDGQEYYVKSPASELAAKVEVLSAKLYQAAGVKVADVNFIKLTGKIGDSDVTGKIGISSKIEKIDDIETSDMAALTGTQEGFAADAWLANWDVVGNGGPSELNLKRLPDGSSFRIDTGGTLFFRAQGGRKSYAANEIPELESIRFNSYNSGDVFGGITDDQIVAGAARIVAISDDDIRRLVDDIMGDDADDLADILIGRKAVLAKTYEKQLKKYNKTRKPKKIERVTDQEVKLVQESRVNGYVLPSDKGDIEDQEIRVNFLRIEGEDKTTINMKLRPAALERIEKTVVLDEAKKTKTPELSFEYENDKVLTAIKGIKTRENQGFEQKDFDRATSALSALIAKTDEVYKMQRDGLISKDDFDNYQLHFGPFKRELGSFLNDYSVGDVVNASDTLFGKLFDEFPPIKLPDLPEAPKKAGLTWKKRDEAAFNRSNFDRSFANQSGEFEAAGTTYETVIDGVKIKIFPSNNDTNLAAMMGRVEIVTDGHSQASVLKAMDLLESYGIDTARATALDREELYLTKIFYHYSGVKRTGLGGGGADRAIAFKEAMKRLETVGSQNERIKQLKKLASEAAGVKNITRLSNYDPVGDYQQYGHGKPLQFNPAFRGGRWEDFHREHLIYQDLEYGGSNQHDSIKNIVNGGGQLASTSDRMRRGIPLGEGGSEIPDMRSGGASYVFARIRKKGDRYTDIIRKGLFWKTNRHATRLDAMSFDDDYYGSQRFSKARSVRKQFDELEDWDVSLQERAVDVLQFEKHARQGTNEIIFKDGLSIFEDLLCFVVDEDRLDEMHKFFIDKGYSKWPDGRKVEDVIVTQRQAKQKGYL